MTQAVEEADESLRSTVPSSSRVPGSGAICHSPLISGAASSSWQ